MPADIRTYAVMPLNEECGLLEWVNNTVAFRSICEKAYARQNKKLYVSERKLKTASDCTKEKFAAVNRYLQRHRGSSRQILGGDCSDVPQ